MLDRLTVKNLAHGDFGDSRSEISEFEPDY